MVLFNMEKWLPVVGFEDYYEVSDLGRVRSVARPLLGKYGAVRMYPGIVRKAVPDKDGYPRIVLRVNGKRLTFAVHRLVCEAFHGSAPQDHQADHIDRDRSNPAAANLRWVTRSENLRNRSYP